jgi:putative exosortase-associated protein (TIGR04073 family)
MTYWREMSLSCKRAEFHESIADGISCLPDRCGLFRKRNMKVFLCSLLSLALCATVVADIQAPPASDFGPTRKLGRGLGNIAFGITEIPYQWAVVNDMEGNAAALSYGLVRGTGRVFARLGYGIYEVALFPFPTHKGGYTPPYRSDIPWINSGYSEFPPELGFETRYDYVRQDPSL